MFSSQLMEKKEGNETKNTLKATRWQILIIVAILIVFATKTALCKIDLEIVQNINDSDASQVTTMLETKNGKNVSLTCKVVNSKSGDCCSNRVVWGKKGKGHRFNNEILGSASLNFTPIGLKNRGTYFCASLKHGLYKMIFITVKPLEILKATPKQRWRREDSVKGSSSYNSEDISIVATDAVPTFHSDSVFIKSTTEDPLRAQMREMFRKKEVIYGANYNSQYTFSDKVREYARVIAPLVATMLIVSTVLYYLMKYFFLCATSRDRHARKRFACPHSTCRHYCTSAMKNTKGKGVSNLCLNGNERASTNVEQVYNINPNDYDDTFIYLPCLFE